MPPFGDLLRSLFGGSPPPVRPASADRVDRIAPWLYIGPFLTPEGFATLPERGITHVLDLREEGTIDEGLLERLGLRWRHVPIADRAAPTDEQLEAIVDWLDSEADPPADQALYVHCHAGVGRTPTIAIALLMRQNLSLTEARRLVFAARPDISPTSSQMAWLESIEARRTP